MLFCGMMLPARAFCKQGVHRPRKSGNAADDLRVGRLKRLHEADDQGLSKFDGGSTPRAPEQAFRILFKFLGNVPSDVMFYVSLIGGELE
jgi:hypothetical protein